MREISNQKIFLAGAKENINRLFKKLNLRQTEREDIYLKAEKGGKRFAYSVCFDREEKKFFFKARIVKNREVLKQLKQEISVYRALKKVSQKRKLDFFFPSMGKAGKFQNIDWYLRNYQEGELAGEMMKGFGFKKSFLRKCPVPKIAKAIVSLEKIPAKSLGLRLEKHGGWWYWQDFKYYKNTFLKFFLPSPFNQGLLTKQELKATEIIFKKNKKFLDQKADVLTHGDFYPNNFLFTPVKKILILDWELLHLNNPAFDPCFVWLLAKNDRKWQKEFFSEMLKNKNREFKKCFRICLLSLNIRFASACWESLRQKKNKKSALSSLKFFLDNFKTALFEPEKFYENF